MADEALRLRFLELATQIVVAAVQTRSIQTSAIPALIDSVFKAVQTAGQPATIEASAPSALVPAVPIKRSVTPEYIICLEDGKHFKSMRGHLRKLGMTPEQYRKKWDLPSNYPIVAPNYAASRSALAVLSGLGKGDATKAKRGHTKKHPPAQ